MASDPRITVLIILTNMQKLSRTASPSCARRCFEILCLLCERICLKVCLLLLAAMCELASLYECMWCILPSARCSSVRPRRARPSRPDCYLDRYQGYRFASTVIFLCQKFENSCTLIFTEIFLKRFPRYANCRPSVARFPDVKRNKTTTLAFHFSAEVLDKMGTSKLNERKHVSIGWKCMLHGGLFEMKHILFTHPILVSILCIIPSKYPAFCAP